MKLSLEVCHQSSYTKHHKVQRADKIQIVSLQPSARVNWVGEAVTV
jgi:hypothetical protein